GDYRGVPRRRAETDAVLTRPGDCVCQGGSERIWSAQAENGAVRQGGGASGRGRREVEEQEVGQGERVRVRHVFSSSNLRYIPSTVLPCSCGQRGDGAE